MRFDLLLPLALATWALAGCSNGPDPPPDQAREAPAPADPATPPDSLVAAGQQAYDKGDYAAAQALWSRALDRARLAHDTAAEAQILTGLGLAAWRLGDYEEARRVGEAAVATKLHAGLTALLPKSYNALGLVAWDQGRLGDAAALFERTMQTARSVGDSEYTYKPTANLGLVYTQLGRFENARRSFLMALASARERGDQRTEGRVLTNLAWLDTETGDAQSALRWVEDARRLARATGDNTGEEALLGQLASAYLALGEPARAFAAVDTALRRARAQGLRQAEAANLELFARLYREAGDFQRALEFYASARALNQELGLAEETGRDLQIEAEIHLALGNLELAERYATQALAIHREIGARPAALADFFVLAELAHARGAHATVQRHLRTARSLAQALDVRSIRVDAAIAEARILDLRGDARRVIAMLDAIAKDLALSGYNVQWEAHALRARAHAALGDLERAAEIGRQSIEAIERTRGNFGSAALRTSYISDKLDAYGELVGVLLRLNRVGEALSIADAARGRAILEAPTRHASVAAPDGARALGRQREELLRINALAANLADAEQAGDSTSLAELRQALQQARRNYESHSIADAERTGTISVPTPGASTSSAAIRSALRPDEALVEFLVAGDRLVTFLLAADGLRSFEIPVSTADLTTRVRLARDLVADPAADPEQARPVLSLLFDLLLRQPLAALEGSAVRRLVLVPHGTLSYLPFAALRDSRDGKYLMEKYALLHVPLAAVLPVLRARAASLTEQRSNLGGGAVFAPLPDALPASRHEARRVGRTLEAVRLFAGRRATESRVREALANGRVVHVASHGVLNARSPLFSRVELATPSEPVPVPENDGKLEMHEVLGLSIRSSLVFLSGCETGLGAAWSTSFTPGEDYATLARAFLYAGARNVIATLWPITDEGAARLAEEFYLQLRRRAPAEALAEAQRAMLRDPRYGHPYYWAAYWAAGEGGLGSEAQKATAVSVR